MIFLNTEDMQTNPNTVYSLLRPILPNSVSIGILCLTGGISYYSWNYSKNKTLNVKTVEKTDDNKFVADDAKENVTLNLDNGTINPSKDEEYDMLDDAKKEINVENDWIIIPKQFNLNII